MHPGILAMGFRDKIWAHPETMRLHLFDIILKDNNKTHNQRHNNHRNMKVGMKMCGRYYIDDDTAREIEKLVRRVDEKMGKAENIHLQAGDIHPSELAPVVTSNDNKLCCRLQRWGFPVLAVSSSSLMPGVNRLWKKGCSGKVWSIGG